MNILTFDIEEWFHLLDVDATNSVSKWNNYEKRIHKNMDVIFRFLNESNLSATFFVVGWIAREYPDLIKKINDLNFEIGSHTNLHQLLYSQSYEMVESDLKDSISILEDITGKKVTSFRAPGFSITEKNKWVFEILFKNGITHDCSIFPANRAHGGFPSININSPCVIDFNGFSIKEFPINTFKILNQNLIFSGGGYFRLTPYKIIKKLSENSNYIMAYFHPRDFDYDQPIIKELSLYRKFKSYVGLKSCMPKLKKWTNEFSFVDIKTADKTINWGEIKVIKI